MVDSKGGSKVVVLETVKAKKKVEKVETVKVVSTLMSMIVQAIKVINKEEMVEEEKVDGW